MHCATITTDICRFCIKRSFYTNHLFTVQQSSNFFKKLLFFF